MNSVRYLVACGSFSAKLAAVDFLIKIPDMEFFGLMRCLGSSYPASSSLPG